MATSLYTARTKAPQPGRPLIFAFHGTGGDEHQFFDLVEHLHPGAGVVSPRGDVSERGAARFFRRTGEGVYDMADLAARTRNMIAFVTSHAQAYPGAPIYGFGYSNGANILASVMMHAPNLFDRIGLLHPLIPWDPAPLPALAGTRVLVTAGRNDPITPFSLTQALIDWLKAQGADLTTAIHEGGHDLQQPELVALARLFADGR